MPVDALEAASQAKQAGMKAIVIKNHFYPTAPIAMVVNQLVPDFTMFGSVCLDYEMGGLNVHAVEYFARAGTRVVWMPTFSSTNSISKMRELGLPLKGEGYSIWNSKGSWRRRSLQYWLYGIGQWPYVANRDICP
jgi:hypothetical protein